MNAALHVDFVYAVHRFQTRQDFIVNDTLQRRDIPFSANAQPHNGENVGRQPKDERVVGLFAQLKSAHPTADFLLGRFHIGAGRKVRRYHRHAGRGNRRGLFQIRQSGDRVFHFRGHVGGDGVRISLLVRRDDVDDREADLGEEFLLDLTV